MLPTIMAPTVMSAGPMAYGGMEAAQKQQQRQEGTPTSEGDELLGGRVKAVCEGRVKAAGSRAQLGT